jgi:hypothetical protein
MAMTAWHDDVSPLSATDVHIDPSVAFTIETYEQQVISPMHTADEVAPLEVPPELPVALVPELLLVAPPLEPPPPVPEQAAWHMAVSHRNVGPSQMLQAIVSHCINDERHIVSRQSTHAVLYPSKMSDEGHTQPLVSRFDAPPSSPPASSPEPPDPPFELDPPPFEPELPPEPELSVLAWSPCEFDPFEPPHAAAHVAMTVIMATAEPAHERAATSIEASHLGYCRQHRR